MIARDRLAVGRAEALRASAEAPVPDQRLFQPPLATNQAAAASAAGRVGERLEDGVRFGVGAQRRPLPSRESARRCLLGRAGPSTHQRQPALTERNVRLLIEGRVPSELDVLEGFRRTSAHRRGEDDHGHGQPPGRGPRVRSERFTPPLRDRARRGALGVAPEQQEAPALGTARAEPDPAIRELYRGRGVARVDGGLGRLGEPGERAFSEAPAASEMLRRSCGNPSRRSTRANSPRHGGLPDDPRRSSLRYVASPRGARAGSDTPGSPRRRLRNAQQSSLSASVSSAPRQRRCRRRGSPSPRDPAAFSEHARGAGAPSRLAVRAARCAIGPSRTTVSGQSFSPAATRRIGSSR